MSKSKKRPNIVLICVDQMRGDCLGSAGHTVVHTPHLDQMYLEGCRFSNAYSATPSCIPARAAIFTGQKQATHGRVGYQDGVPWNYETTLAGEFTKNGYQTQAIGKMHVYPERSQMGFQNVILHDGYLHFARNQSPHDMIDDYIPWLRKELGRDADYFDNGLNCNSYVARPWDKPEYTHPTNFVVTKGIEFLRQRDPRKPFFLYLSFHRPHPPLDPPQWAFDQHMDADMPDVPVGDWTDYWKDQDNSLHPALTVGKLPPQRLKRARAAYYGQISHIDHQLNRFFEVMAEYGQHNNTIYCFTSDHGDMLGDHNMFRKTVPYEGSANVPMILKGPGFSGIKRGITSDAVCELRDVMPTLLDCAGLPIPDSVEGRSLLPYARGEEPGWREYIHGEHTNGPNLSYHWITDGSSKYIWMSDTGKEQFFDLSADPQECHDLIDEESAVDSIELFRNRLIKELTDREEGYVKEGELVLGRAVKPCLSVVTET